MKIISVVSGLSLAFVAIPIHGDSIPDLLSNDTDLTTAYAAAEAAGLVDALDSDDLTLFAPTNDAFAAVDQDLLATLLTPPWIIHLQAFLLQHVVVGTYESTNITDALTLESEAAMFSPLATAPITFSVNKDGVTASGLAFTDSNIVEVDILADNGVVHKVDQVFVPQMLAQTLWQTMESIPEGFAVFKQFLMEYGVSEILEGPDAITVFAVPDSVLTAIPEDALAAVNITDVLFNHIVAGVLPSSAVVDGMQITTLAGMTYTVTVLANGTALVGTVPIVAPNLLGSNGIAHVIGGVLIPDMSGSPEMSETPAPTPASTAGDGGSPAPTSPGTEASSAARLGVRFAAGAAVAWWLL